MKQFTRQEALNASLFYFKQDDLAASTFTDKYALQNDEIFYELTPTDTHRRLAKEFARIEQKYPNPLSEETIFDLFQDWTLIPQGSPMSGIGNNFQLQSISNCFVIEPAQDSYGGIFRADQEQAQIMKRRGGVGHDISNIRPKGVSTSNAAKTTDGIAVFMDRFSNTTREVAQNGRRGALMLSISVHHPEIETFINIKRDKTRVTGANISVRVSNAFMDAVCNDTTYVQQWPVESATPSIVKEVSAKAIWDKMMLAAWESAEPGVLFWDTIIRNSPAECYADVGYKTSSTNPWGELPLCPLDSCRLLLQNLFKFVVNPYKPNAYFDFVRFEAVAAIAQRLMDDMIDLEIEMINKIISKIEQDPERDEVKAIELNLWKNILRITSNGRRTGLGETGLGDALAALGIKYGSDESVAMTEKIHKALAIQSYSSSILMAKERGAFSVFSLTKEVGHPFVSRIIAECSPKIQEMYQSYGRRNIANLTIAPAGSMSILCQSTSGCEPAFRLNYTRRKKNTNLLDKADFVDSQGDRWTEFEVFHHGHLEWARINNKDPRVDLKESPYFGATANEIDWLKKVEIQAAAQRWVDHSISNTTNIPSDTTVDTVKEIYMKGWKDGCKGITIYRDNSRAGVLIDKLIAVDSTRGTDVIRETHAPKRPKSLPCDIHRAKVKGEEYIILVGLLQNKPYEVFCGLAANIEVGKKEKHGTLVKHSVKGGVSTYNLVLDNEEVFENVVDLFDNPAYGSLSRTLSISLRHGVPVQYVVEQLRKDKYSDMFSFSTVVARVLSKSYIIDGTKPAEKLCTACSSSNLSYQQGCVSCLDCGNSKCG